jgi:hypothetical protein
MTQGPPNPKRDFVAMPDPRAGRRRIAWEPLWLMVRVPMLIAALGALVVTSLLLYTSDRRTTRQAELTVSPEQAESLRRLSLGKEAQFEKLRQERFELTEADVALLDEALRAQEEYITARGAIGTDDARQQSLRRRLHLLRGERLRHESDQAEANALELAKTDESAAIPLLRRAVACEAEIEAKWEFSGLADPGRRARLDTRLRRLESAPLWREGRAHEAEAEKLFTAGKFAESAAKFDQAIGCETDFLARYRDVRDTEFGRVDKLAERRETALSGEAWRGVTTRRAQAEAAERAGDWPAATLAWQSAADAFTRLLADHPRSSFADRAQAAGLTTRLNFARFHDDIRALRAKATQLRLSLRERRADVAVRQAEDAVGEARRLAAADTGVFLAGDPEREELEYLAANAAVLRGVLGAADANLRPVPGTTVRIYRTEVPQGLYAAVMGANPSSVRREANPVESVTYAEAEAFALRYGWLLGVKARLPTPAEFAAAAGDLGRDPIMSAAGEVGPVGRTAPNAFGIHDLLGNVEEWAQADSADTRAPVLGGSGGLPTKGLPARAVYKREKSRTLGFRIVIE